jgi:putative redox protein
MVAKRANSVPRVFTKSQAIFTITSWGVSLAKAEEAVKLSAEKYCSASRMLEKSAKIVFRIKVLEIH